MKSLRILIALCALVVGAGAYLSTVPDAEAIIIPGPGVCAYFSNKNLQGTPVGARGTGCCGSVINWGIITPYRRCEPLYCTDQICPN